MKLSHNTASHIAGLVAALVIMLIAFAGHNKARAGDAAHGFSPVHELKYPSGFRHFSYVHADAPKTGTLRLGAIGTFDSLNTLRYPGHTPSSRDERFSIHDFIYDTLLFKSADEPAAYYGLLAESVEVADDHSWARFTLRPDARWHDGQSITPEDIRFTFATLTEQGPPYLRQILRGVEVVVENASTVLIKAPRPGDRDFAPRVGNVPIHPKHFWQKNDVNKSGLTPPLGSGPYRVVAVDAGRKITFERVPDYWGKAHPVNTGRHNFARIEIEFFRDSTVALEAFKAGKYDLRVEKDAVRWATGYDGPALTRKKIVKSTFTPSVPGQMMTLVFNVRRGKFKHRNVRRAIALAYDFDWTNKSLFHGQYTPVGSFFSGTRNAASGKAGEGERELLKPHLASLPDGILDAPSSDSTSSLVDRRDALREAKRLLDAAGYKVRDAKRIDPATGEPMSIRLAYINPGLRKVFGAFARSLDKLGIALSYPTLEPITASKTILSHDYDMAALSRWNPGLVPGTSESLVWGSALADRTPSYALSGAKDAALDATIAAMTRARSLDSLENAARAFDRVLRWQQYAIPMWRTPSAWIAHRNTVGLPSFDGLDMRSIVDLAWHADDAARASQ